MGIGTACQRATGMTATRRTCRYRGTDPADSPQVHGGSVSKAQATSASTTKLNRMTRVSVMPLVMGQKPCVDLRYVKRHKRQLTQLRLTSSGKVAIKGLTGTWMAFNSYEECKITSNKIRIGRASLNNRPAKRWLSEPADDK